MVIKRFLQNIVPVRIIETKSIITALREQKLLPLFNQLTTIVPDITHQYSSITLDTEYLKAKVRGQHAFQMDLVNEALQLINGSKKEITIVDIGDSAGTHLQYTRALHKKQNFHCLSVNIDLEAVKKIRQAGLEAIHARAEDLTGYSVDADILLSFEMLEHLMNPCGFLHSFSESTNCKAFVITVPYVAYSRVGFRHIRQNQKRSMNAESTHIFELSPHDWRLVFMHSGWAILADRVYFQYPRKLPFSFLLKKFWRRNDFEGFYGAILRPDRTWSKLYVDW